MNSKSIRLFISLCAIAILLTSSISPSLMVQDAEALKSKGNYRTEINSKKVCGDKLCSEIKLEEDIGVPTRGGGGIGDVAKYTAKGILNGALGAVGADILNSFFPSGDDGISSADLDRLEDELKMKIDQSTNKILDAMDSMKSDILIAIGGVTKHIDKTTSAKAQAAVDGLYGYLQSEHQDKKNNPDWTDEETYRDLGNKYDDLDIVTHLNTITASGDDLQYLRQESFSTFWYGKLGEIVYYQELALLDPHSDTSNSVHLKEIPRIVDEMNKQLEQTKKESKELRQSLIPNSLDCDLKPYTKKIYGVAVYDGPYATERLYTIESVDFKAIPNYTCKIQESSTGQQFSVGGKCKSMRYFDVGIYSQYLKYKINHKEYSLNDLYEKYLDFRIDSGDGQEVTYSIPSTLPESNIGFKVLIPICDDRDFLNIEKKLLDPSLKSNELYKLRKQMYDWIDQDVEDQLQVYADAMECLQNLKERPIPGYNDNNERYPCYET